ncbi:hypothetical conserved protein [Candidatus Nitrosoglobus terrae]|uniref:Hypothetical conserved protein n=1 Tax=Candidatus Nitrosoglobus terrae TaxID=1630141 RepID=A0A1Q2SM20_9GAMM|nr:hypothetical protein [Candidatus Nitrosoglobus terrae]BAW80170.1 hypothetical conserved protein [Candidatus Nitrosoglobus terrae]
MRNKQIIVFIIAALKFNANAVAHDQVGSLGEDASATDYYLVMCSTSPGGETGLLRTQILDATTTAGGGKISVVSQFQNETMIKAATASDPNRLDDQPGPAAILPGANGAFNVFVHKLKEGPKNYQLTYHCMTSEGSHTGTSLTTIQDQ